jgi:hypothetical protein
MRWSCQRIEDSSLRQSFTRRENTFRQVAGNLRFPLTVTYHGCHLFLPVESLSPGILLSAVRIKVSENPEVTSPLFSVGAKSTSQ